MPPSASASTSNRTACVTANNRVGAMPHPLQPNSYTRTVYSTSLSDYTNPSQTTTMETWSSFSTSDIFMAFMGLIGLLTALIVVKTAFANTDSIERNRK